MKPEPNKQQFEWLNQAEELNDVEASHINGGSSIDAVSSIDVDSSADGSFNAALAEFRAQNERAQQRNLEMMKIQVEEGTALKAAGQQVNPK